MQATCQATCWRQHVPWCKRGFRPLSRLQASHLLFVVDCVTRGFKPVVRQRTSTPFGRYRKYCLVTRSLDESGTARSRTANGRSQVQCPYNTTAPHCPRWEGKWPRPVQPRLVQSLPDYLKDSELSIDIFKRYLKTYFFRSLLDALVH